MLNTAPPASRPPICSALTTLPDPLARTALSWAGDRQTAPADIRDLRCTLEHHVTGDHYAMVHDATATTAIWTRWPPGGTPEILLVLPDCPATDPVHGGCCEYEGHPGGHNWQVHDPWDSHHALAVAAVGAPATA